MISIPLLVSIIAGLWNGILVAYAGIQPIIATLILMVAGRGIAQLMIKGQTLVFEHPSFQFIGSGYFLGLPFPIIIVTVVFIFIYLATRKTALGMFIEAVGSNPSASRVMGIRTRLIKIMVYIFSGLCAGRAGLIITADIKCADANNAGLLCELDAIASVIIGGTMWGGRFSLGGSVIGALIIQSLTTTILLRGVPPEVTLVFKAIIIIVVVLIQAEKFRKFFFGLFSRIKGKNI